MKIRSLLFLVAATVCGAVSFSGCSGNQPTSVTEDADQAAIDAYKEMEAKLEAETMGQMEGDDLQ
ncbi:hypothetical protein Enr13x_55860 [Stieleria neptunia]|uniref:Secreted protein n=1 Tax=Stieleria neptunia TaxID=2527979 RepID=A0A518HY63_9BACT|nr:hypothetical protein [Stieleria neptunia]QDV45707.1 hypothetical protein Enr13x_55860 [Stieleria neptunia]